MNLTKIEIENYKCFWKPQKVELDNGFNLFVGANNSGKTTMLEALDLNVGLNEPHRSFRNLLKYGERPNGSSRFVATFLTDIHEIHRIVGNYFEIPLPDTYINELANTSDTVAEVIEHLIAQPVINITLESNSGAEVCDIESILGPSPKIYRNRSENLPSLSLFFKDNSPPQGRIATCSPSSSIWALREWLRPYIYRFSAQRRPAGVSSGGGALQLDREAINLPYCINHLQSYDAHGHRLLCEWVNRVFPDVKWVQAPPNGGGFELICLPLPPEARRNDLAIRLDRMGAGIGNVIAILYVVLTSRYPQVIAIDEPNSFLHPRALRELLQILSAEGRQHQFILTAHSADVLTAVNPSLITLFEFDGACTTIKQVDGKDITSLRGNLADLGIRMTDLHGRDRVLWVEGQTEEIVMPELLRYFCPEIAAGIAVLRVEYTGTFEKKGVDPTEVAKLYKRLTESSALVPPMAAILLDGETRDPRECSRLKNSSDGILQFLEHRMLENYLLIPEAISVVLNELGEEVSVVQVKAALVEAIGARALAGLHGADILGQIFSDLSGTRHEFKKTRDVPQIVGWLLSNKPDELKDLGNFLRDLFSLQRTISNEKVGIIEG